MLNNILNPQNQIVFIFVGQTQNIMKTKNKFKDLKNYLARLRWYIEVYAELYTGEPDDDEAQRHLNFSILRVMN